MNRTGLPASAGLETDENAQLRLRNLLNASGFAFQIGLSSAVTAGSRSHGWSVAAEEHPWATGNQSGYADIVLKRGAVHLVVECKRNREANWIFLIPDKDQLARSHARALWTCSIPHRDPVAGWDDIQVDPSSPEAAYCVVAGQSDRNESMLERIAAQTCTACDGIAEHLMEITKQQSSWTVVLPVIVTNATLSVGRFDPGAVDLKTGDVSDAEFRTVPAMRFRKTLAPAVAPEDFEAERLRDMSYRAERTVFVVNSAHLDSWLTSLSLARNDINPPWAAARARALALG